MKFVRQGLAFFVFLLFTTAPAISQQGTIAGTVTGAVDGAGLATVQVQVLRSGGSVVDHLLRAIFHVDPDQYRAQLLRHACRPYRDRHGRKRAEDDRRRSRD